jgi:hypothetical protein
VSDNKGEIEAGVFVFSILYDKQQQVHGGYRTHEGEDTLLLLKITFKS